MMLDDAASIVSQRTAVRFSHHPVQPAAPPRLRLGAEAAADGCAGSLCSQQFDLDLRCWCRGAAERQTCMYSIHSYTYYITLHYVTLHYIT